MTEKEETKVNENKKNTQNQRKLQTRFDNVASNRKNMYQTHEQQTAKPVPEENDILSLYSRPGRIQAGVHIEEDIYKVLQNLKDKHGRGIISDLVNSQLRRYFKEKGLL